MMPLQVPIPQAHPRNLLDKGRREFQREHGSVQHHAPRDLKQNRAPIPHNNRMPDPPRQPQFVHHADHHREVTKKRKQHSRAHHWAVPLESKQIHGSREWHTGYAFTTVSEAFPVSFNANSPAVFIGKQSDIRVRVHNDPNTGQIQLFADPTAANSAFTGPISLNGPTRNNLRGPRFSNTNLSLNKHFQLHENYALEFRAEAYNVFNQVNFSLPQGSVADINNPSTFGVITSDSAPDGVPGPRVMQFSLRFDF